MGDRKNNGIAIPHLSRSIFRAYQLAWIALDWLYPPTCGGCGKSYVRWCQNCQQQVRQIRGLICEYCGGDMSVSEIHHQCSYEAHLQYPVRSFAFYEGPIRAAIHKLKYKGDIALGEILARPMIDILRASGWEIDLVAPVPGSLARKKMRGYNQASLLAFPIALACGIPYAPGVLVKIRETRSQVGLSARERGENVANAFMAQKDLVAKKNILVIDDVTTSGATMDACAEALLGQQAQRVFGLTLARAVL